MLGNLRANIKDHGLKSILRSLDWRTPKWLFWYRHTVMTCGPLEVSGEAPDDGYTVGIAKLEEAAQFTELGLSEPVFRNRIDAGDVCGVVRTPDGRLASMLWTSTGHIYLEDVGHTLNLDPDGTYIYNVYTAKSERRKGLFTRCARVVYDSYQKQGRTKVYAVISIYNIPSRTAFGRIGSDVVGEVILIRSLGLEMRYTRKWVEKVSRLRIGIGRADRGLRRV